MKTFLSDWWGAVGALLMIAVAIVVGAVVR